MTAGNYDWYVDQGSDAVLTFTLYSDKARQNPQSLSGASIACKVRTAPESTTVIATGTGTVLDGPNGQGQVSFSAAITAAIAADNSGTGNRKLTTFVFDIEVTYADATVQRVLEGNWYLSPEVTK